MHLSILFNICRFFLTEEKSKNLIKEITPELIRSNTGYKRYILLVYLRILYEALKSKSKLKVPLPVDFDQAFVLLLRDRFTLSSSQIAYVVASSEGTVRTRLEKARARAFSKLPELCGDREGLPQNISPQNTWDSKDHFCIQIRDKIEDIIPLQPNSSSMLVEQIKGCKLCLQIFEQKLTSYKHFQNLPEFSLPKSISNLEFETMPMIKSLVNWRTAPWYIKLIAEGILATALVSVIVLSAPYFKHMYEYWLERRLDLYTINELGLSKNENTSLPVEEATSEKKENVTADPQRSLAVKPETEFGSRDAERASADKIYRVLIKTDAPEALKNNVFSVLNNVPHEPASERGIAGDELPGGILFDIYVPLHEYKNLVNNLVKLGETKFFITRSKERQVPGKAHFKIWLQKI